MTRRMSWRTFSQISSVPCEVGFQSSSSCILDSACIGIVSPCWLKITQKQWGPLTRIRWTHAVSTIDTKVYHFCRSFQIQLAPRSSDPHSGCPSSVKKGAQLGEPADACKPNTLTGSKNFQKAIRIHLHSTLLPHWATLYKDAYKKVTHTRIYTKQ